MRIHRNAHVSHIERLHVEDYIDYCRSFGQRALAASVINH